MKLYDEDHEIKHRKLILKKKKKRSYKRQNGLELYA